MKTKTLFSRLTILFFSLYLTTQLGFSVTPPDNWLTSNAGVSTFGAGIGGPPGGPISGLGTTAGVKLTGFPLLGRTSFAIEGANSYGFPSPVGLYIGCAADGSGGTLIGSISFPVGAKQKLSFTITALPATQNLWIKLTTTGPPTDLYSFEANGEPFDVTPPSVPTGVAAVPGTAGTSATVSWNASTDDVGGMGLDHYEIFDGTTLLGKSIGTAISAKIYRLSGATTYNISVKAVDKLMNTSAASTPVALVMPAAKVNLALNKTTTATEEDAGGFNPPKYAATKAVDNDTSTWWQPTTSAAVTLDWNVDLGALFYLDRIEIDWKLPNPVGSLQYKIQTSEDGITYTDAFGTAQVPSLTTEFDFSSSFIARYVRIHISGVAGGKVGISEVRVYNISGKIVVTAPPICVVRFDKQERKNMIVWERQPGKNIKEYKILKQISTTDYDTLATLPYDVANTYYIDTTTDPDVLAMRYKICAVDSSGRRSRPTPYHRTMNLSKTLGSQANQIVLIWNEYEDESKTYVPSNYHIYRGKDSLVWFVDQAAGSATYNVNMNNVVPGEMFQIVTDKVPACNSALPLKADAGPYSQSMSNIIEFKAQDLPGHNIKLITVCPNPASTEVTVYTDLRGVLVMTEISGQTLKQLNVTEYETRIHIAGIPAGCYIISIRADSAVGTAKLIVE